MNFAAVFTVEFGVLSLLLKLAILLITVLGRRFWTPSIWLNFKFELAIAVVFVKVRILYSFAWPLRIAYCKLVVYIIPVTCSD